MSTIQEHLDDLKRFKDKRGDPHWNGLVVNMVGGHLDDIIAALEAYLSPRSAIAPNLKQNAEALEGWAKRCREYAFSTSDMSAPELIDCAAAMDVTAMNIRRADGGKETNG